MGGVSASRERGAKKRASLSMLKKRNTVDTSATGGLWCTYKLYQFISIVAQYQFRGVYISHVLSSLLI